MEELISKIEALKGTLVQQTIDCRLREFASFRHRGDKEWFGELCFCLLTANARADRAISIQAQLGAEGFCHACYEDVLECIVDHKHRFHNTKAKNILAARQHSNIKSRIIELVLYEGESGARDWLVQNIRGIGYKEASHFLRNVGYNDLAILDRHILRIADENGIIKELPGSLSRKTYLAIEEKLRRLAVGCNMTLAELDLYLWYMKTGRILK